MTTSEITHWQISFVLLHFLSTEGASILTVGSMTESHLHVKFIVEPVNKLLLLPNMGRNECEDFKLQNLWLWRKISLSIGM